MRNRLVKAVVFAGLLVAAALLAPRIDAQEKAVPETGAQITYSFAPVVKKAAPAVVNIYTKSKVQANVSPFGNDPFFQQFFRQQFNGPKREQMIGSLGSGVIVRPEGMIVTSLHVVKDAQEITVILTDKREFAAKVLVKDPQSDLAFLKIEAPNPLPFLEMRDSDTLEVGDLVLAIGNPFGVGQTVTNGIVSALARRAEGVSDYQFFIQTDAAINPGNSGGALVDMQARLVGINTAIYSRSGGSQGIGFAIPANMVRSLLGGKVQGGHVVKPWLGLEVQPVTKEMAESMGMAQAQGAIVRNVSAGSPSDKAGFKVGDVLLMVGNAPVASMQDVEYRMALAGIGDTVKLTILRAGVRQMLDATLAPPPETTPRDQRVLKGLQPLSGATVANLSPALAAELGHSAPESGVVVIAPGQSELGVMLPMQPGDIMLEANGVKITSVAQLESVMNASRDEWHLAYLRNGQILTLNIKKNQ